MADWDLKLKQTMVEIFPLRSADAAYNKISGMLASLGDPFTRIISPKEYQSFRIGSDGNLQGVGLFINTEPNSGHLVSGITDIFSYFTEAFFDNELLIRWLCLALRGAQLIALEYTKGTRY